MKGGCAAGAEETTPANDAIEVSYGLGWGLQKTPHGWGAFKEGQGIFGRLLRLTIADSFTPLEWENYIPYDRPPARAMTAEGC